MAQLISNYMFESCLVLAFVLTGFARALAIRFKVFDVPNERSSHSRIVPRGGGIAIVATVFVAMGIVLSDRLGGAGDHWMMVGLGGLLVAAAGLTDDIRSLSASKRAAVHFVASVLLVWAACPPAIAPAGWFGFLGLVVLSAWFINLYNFMDGTDGLSSSVGAITAFGVFAFFASVQSTDANLLSRSLCGACTGFLIWNVPPARIFMGDVGSGFLGYAFAALMMLVAREAPGALLTVPILLSTFIADTGVTLARRFLRGEKWYEAHRSHAYQKLAQSYGHRKVMISYSGVTLLYLIPLAWAASRVDPLWSWGFLAAAWTPLVICAVFLGAGVEEAQRA